MRYFSVTEKNAMLEWMRAFDRRMIHENRAARRGVWMSNRRERNLKEGM